MACDAEFEDSSNWLGFEASDMLSYDDPYADATTLETDPSVQDDGYADYEQEYDDDFDDTHSSFNAAAYFGDPELTQGHSLAAELRPGEKFNQKIPPTYDGQMSYFAYEKLVVEW